MLSDEALQQLGIALCERHDSIDSTNTRAVALAGTLTAADLPALVISERQTAGRGRGANRWWSSDGALTFSLVLDASQRALPPPFWPLVSLTAAIAIADTLSYLVPSGLVQLKWPNDVYLGGKKICGILVEAPPVRPARLVVGIGLNVNNALADAPEEIRGLATSLVEESGRRQEPQQVLASLLSRFFHELEELATGRLVLTERWQPRCLLTGRTVTLDSLPGDVTGRCAGVDERGALLLETERGRHRFFAGVVKSWSA